MEEEIIIMMQDGIPVGWTRLSSLDKIIAWVGESSHNRSYTTLHYRS